MAAIRYELRSFSGPGGVVDGAPIVVDSPEALAAAIAFFVSDECPGFRFVRLP